MIPDSSRLMNRVALRLLPLPLALLLAAPALAQEGFEPPASWTTPIEPFPIAEGLYYVGSAELTAFLLTGDEGHVLIDAPMEENVDAILGNIRRLGFDPADVRIQLASHAHMDHVGGIASLVAATGAELILSPPAVNLLSVTSMLCLSMRPSTTFATLRATNIPTTRMIRAPSIWKL